MKLQFGHQYFSMSPTRTYAFVFNEIVICRFWICHCDYHRTNEKKTPKIWYRNLRELIKSWFKHLWKRAVAGKFSLLFVPTKPRLRSKHKKLCPVLELFDIGSDAYLKSRNSWTQRNYWRRPCKTKRVNVFAANREREGGTRNISSLASLPPTCQRFRSLFVIKSEFRFCSSQGNMLVPRSVWCFRIRNLQIPLQCRRSTPKTPVDYALPLGSILFFRSERQTNTKKIFNALHRSRFY